jgi:hypothetical protein
VALSDDQKAMLRLLAGREQGYDDIAALTGSSVAEVRAKVSDATAALDSGLSQDQRAMLRLLAQREEGYDDIAALTGASVEEVRARVRTALDGLEGDAAPSPSPAPKAATVPPPPKAEKRPAPVKPARPAPRPAAGKPASAGLPGGVRLPEDRGVRRALAAGGAVVLVLILLLLTGVIGGDDDGDSASTRSGESTLADEVDLPEGGQEPTEAVLSAVDGSDAKGQALFGRSGRNVVLLLSAEGLRPSPAGRSYTVSLVRSPTQRLPLVAAEATESGIISGRFQIAPQVLGLLAGGFDEMEVSLVDDDVLRAALAQARKTQKAPDYDGTTVLSGAVTGPIVEAGEG